MFEEFVRAPMPFKVQLSCQIVYYYLYSFENIFLDFKEEEIQGLDSQGIVVLNLPNKYLSSSLLLMET